MVEWIEDIKLEDTLLKKLLALSLLSLSLLTACATKMPSQLTTSSSEQTLSSSELQAALEERLALLNQADFPQLSKDIAPNEAAVKLKTNKGDITIKLFPEHAPLTVENFLTHAKAGYYDGLIFHRVMKDFMIQGGDPQGTGRGGQSIWAGKDSKKDPGSGFQDEFSDYLYNIRGSLSMANAGPHTNGSQFFINQNTSNQTAFLDPIFYPEKIIAAYATGGNPSLDHRHTVFGQVIEGMDVVDAIASVPTDGQDKPKEDVIITGIEVIKE